MCQNGQLAFTIRQIAWNLPSRARALGYFHTSVGICDGKHGSLGTYSMSLSRPGARMMGGDVAVTSEPGRGSVFTVRISAEGMN